MSGVSTTTAPKRSDYLLLELVAAAYSRMEELTPLSVMMRKSVSDQVYVTPLSLYKLASES